MSDSASVIGASAIVAYLFVPFKSGTKPPTPVIAAHFAGALVAVSAVSAASVTFRK